MKKIFTLLFLGLASYTASAQTVFTQNFSSSATVTDYFTTVNGGAGTVNGSLTGNKFTSLATVGAPTNSINVGTFQLVKPSGTDGSAIQLNGLSATGTECLAVAFDVNVLSASANGQPFNIYFGNGTTAANADASAAANVFGALGAYVNNAGNTTYGFDFRAAPAGGSNTYVGGSARATGTSYRVVLVVNASANPVTYTGPNGSAGNIVATQSYDIWISNVKATTSSIPKQTAGPSTFTDMRIVAGTGNIATSTIAFDNFDVKKLLDGGTLPVSFTQLSAKLSGSDVNVNWSTASEQNNDHFDVEASTDGKTFKTIKTVATQNGNSSALQNYSETISISDIAGLLAIPALLGLVGFAPMSRRRKFATLALVGFVAATSFASCQKEGKDLLSQQSQGNEAILSGKKTIYIRIKQVDKDGTATYSNVVVAK
jgi:hypothetical protein